MSLLTLSRISKAYGSDAALSAIDLAVEPGEVSALVGENGAGKSTLMRLVGAHADSHR